MGPWRPLLPGLVLSASLVCGTAPALAQTGLFALGFDGRVSRIDPYSSGATTECTLPASVGEARGLAHDCRTGTTYVTSLTNRALYTLNIDTGATTLVGAFDASAGAIGPIAFDFRANLLLGSAVGRLYLIDPHTAATTLIGDTGLGEITALAYHDGARAIYAATATGLFSIAPDATPSLVSVPGLPADVTGLAFDGYSGHLNLQAQGDQLSTILASGTLYAAGAPPVASGVAFPERIRAHWTAMSTRRVDFAVCGDSNQFQYVTPYRGYGVALMKVLADRYGLYAERLMSARAFGSQPAEVFGSSGDLDQAGWQASGAPAGLATRMFDPVSVENVPYSGWLGGYMYLPSGVTSPSTGTADGGGPYIGVPNDPFGGMPSILPDITANGYRHSFSLYWPAGSTGEVHPTVRIFSTSIILTPNPDATWSLAGTPAGVPTPDQPFDASITVQSNALPHTRQMQMQARDLNAAQGAVGLMYHRAEATSIQAGAGLTIPHAAGGKGLRFFVKSLLVQQSASPQALPELMRQMCKLQSGPPMLAWMFMHKGNDTFDTSPSYVWTGTTALPFGPASNTAEGYRNNLESAIRLLDAAWLSLGYDPANLVFIDSLYHPQSEATHAAALPQFEAASRDLAATGEGPFARLTCVAGSQMITPDEMYAKAWYRLPPFDTAHLTSDAYFNLELLQVRSIEAALGRTPRFTGLTWIPDAPCSLCGTSDFNGDEDFATDQDIEAFFACIGGNCCPTCWRGGADFNGDGDVATDQDIESFFRVIGGGPC